MPDFLGSFDPLLRRPYSVYRAHRETSALTFLVRPFGRGSAWLAERRARNADMLGPLGNSFTIPARAQRLLMIGGGVGVAPLVMLSGRGAELGTSTWYSSWVPQTSRGLLPRPSYDGASNTSWRPTTAAAGHRGLATEVIADFVQWADQIYACGPEPMYRTLRAVIDPLRTNRRPNVQISVERGMACGLGRASAASWKPLAG